MQRRFTLYAWGVLTYNLLVILWGAFVRATGSGAGCGRHWPLCNGQVIPRAQQVETLIEFSHRVTSSLDGLLVIGLVIWALRAFPRGHLARRGAWLSLGFVIFEGILGAGLVLFELTAHNASFARAVAMAAHLINTLLLLSVITLTAWWSSGGGAIRWRGQGAIGTMLGIGLLAVMFLGASGAVTALGDTLFPAGSLREGLAQDFDPLSHFLLRLRIWHPSLSIVTGIYLVVVSQIVARRRPTQPVRVAAAVLMLLFVAQLAIGAVNVLLLAPVAMQLIHLLMADLVWIALVLLSASALAVEAPTTAPRPALAATR